MDTGNLNVLADLSASIIDKVQDNIVLNAFRIAVNGSLTQFNMIDGIVDEYEDESGIDLPNSTNESYDSVNDLYSPLHDIISTSPFAHYKLNDNAGNTTVTDDGTGANNGTGNVNTSNYSVAGQGGELNTAFDLNGTTEFINLDALNTDVKTDTTGTIACWINIDNLSSSSTIFSLNVTAGDIFCQMVVLPNGTLRFSSQFSGPNFHLIQSNTGVITTGTWFHIALVQNGTEGTWYLNGSAIATTNTPGGTGANTDWFAYANGNGPLDNGRIGVLSVNGGNQGFFDGQIDDFRYYSNIALNSSEIALLYNSGSGTEETNPEDEANNMTLISNTFTAEAQADNARIVLFEEDVDSITLNTDLKVFASRDGGTTFSQITLVNEGEYESGRNILSASVDISGQPAGTEMLYKIETANNKDLKIHGTGLSWD